MCEFFSYPYHIPVFSGEKRVDSVCISSGKGNWKTNNLKEKNKIDTPGLLSLNKETKRRSYDLDIVSL